MHNRGTFTKGFFWKADAPNIFNEFILTEFCADQRMVGTFKQEVPMILLNNQWCYSMPTFLHDKVPGVNRYQL